MSTVWSSALPAAPWQRLPLPSTATHREQPQRQRGRISLDNIVTVARIVENGPFFFTHLAAMLRVKGTWRVCACVYNRDA